MTSAPADAPTLLAFLAPPPGRILPEGGEGDTTREVPPPNTQNTPTNTQNTPPNFSLPDTSRRDTTRSFPGGDPAALETIGPSSSIRSFPTGTSSSAPTIRGRRGLLGIHPLAILAGLIVLDVFIVKVASK
jgi:hypothetical protein